MEFIKKYAGLIVGGIVATIYALSFVMYPIVAKNDLAFNLVDIHISLSKWLVYGLIGLTLFFFAIKVSKNPKSGIRFGIGIALLGLIFSIAYSSASSDTSELTTGLFARENEYKIVGGMITTTVVLIIVGLSALAVFWIKNLIENAKT